MNKKLNFFLSTYKVYIFIFLIISIILFVDFKKNLKRDFYQLGFDWQGVEVVQDYGKINIDSMAHNILVVKSENNLSEKIQSEKYTYELDVGNKIHYFRCSSIQTNNKRIFLRSGVWLTTFPSNSISKGKLRALHIPLKKEFQQSVCFIGDSHICWKSAKALRKNLYPYLEMNFLGNNVDLFGYPFVGSEKAKVKMLLNNSKEIPEADYYLIFLGAQDFNNNIDYAKVENDFKKLINDLRQKKLNTKLILVTLPRSTSKKRNQYNMNLNEYFRSLKSNNINIIDLQQYLDDNKINNYLYIDGIHLNERGYYYLNKLIRNSIKNLNES